MAPAAITAYTPEISVDVCQKTWQLCRAASLERLWEAMTDEDDERLPYWTELWPSSIALSTWLWQNKDKIHKAYCLDMGCGLGLTTLVGQWLGAQVIGMDYEEVSLGFALRNATLNNVTQPLWTVMDWRKPALRAHLLAYIWGGDIMYERRFVDPVLRFLSHSLAPQGKVWIAEPCRAVYNTFLAALHHHNFMAKTVFTQDVDPLYAQPVPVTVHIWELTHITGS